MRTSPSQSNAHKLFVELEVPTIGSHTKGGPNYQSGCDDLPQSKVRHGPTTHTYAHGNTRDVSSITQK